MKGTVKMKRNNILQYLVLTVIALTSVIASWNMYKTPSKSAFGGVLLVVSVCGLVTVLVMACVSSATLKKYIMKMTSEITQTEKESLFNFPAPVAIIDEKKQIVWVNKEFDSQVLSDEQAYRMYIGDLADFDFDKMYSPKGNIISLGERYYRVRGIENTHDDTVLSMIYFNEITDYVDLDFEYKQSRPSVMLVAVDNYEDLLQNMRESEKAKVYAELEQLMESFFDTTTGVVRKLSSTQFLIVLEYRHLKPMIDSRFLILDKAREIAVGERATVTLSIGVGLGAKTLAESAEYAKQGIDMCFGRGGDQAAVKTVNGFEFYGGVSKGVEKQTKVRTRIIASALKDLIAESNRVFVMGHANADLDAVGASIGLASIIRRHGTAAYVVVDPVKNLATQLIDYMNGKQKRDLFISPQQAIEAIDEQTLLIVVDTHNPDFVDSKELLAKASKVVVVDHHRRMVKSIDNPVIFYHEPLSSSASEMVAELVQYFGNDCRISANEAEALLAGIMLDTKNFVMRTGVRTFEAAAYLRKLGADTVSVKNLFASSIETYQQKSMLITNSEIYKGCAVATARATSPTMRIAAPQAADELLGIEGVSASFVLYETDGRISISARSLGSFNVQLVMEELGGGGHQTMAGAQLDSSLREAKFRLINAIDSYIEKSTTTV